MTLSKKLHKLLTGPRAVEAGRAAELGLFLAAHPSVDGEKYLNGNQFTDIDYHHAEWGMLPLHVCVRRGFTDCARMLLEHKASVNAVDIKHSTPLQSACGSDAGNDPVECVQLLIEAKARVDAHHNQGRTKAIHRAAGQGNMKCLQALIDHGAEVDPEDRGGNTPLLTASASEHDLPDCVHLLIEAKANVDAANNEGSRAVHRAAKHGNLKCLQSLVDHGAALDTVNHSSNTALFYAGAYSSECVQVLIDGKANVNVADMNGATAVHHAAGRAFKDNLIPPLTSNGLQLLIDGGGDVHAVDHNGCTPLLTACMRNGEIESVRILIKAKADVHAVDNSGSNVLHYAAFYGKPKHIQLLVDNKADVKARTTSGTTPAMQSCMKSQLPCLQLLLDNKADINVRTRDMDALYHAIPLRVFVFPVLCCNTDTKSRNYNKAKLNADIKKYKLIHAYIDQVHGVLNDALSTEVVVDTRIGLGEYGIYQEPLERTLEYMGLSMHKDQVVNASIDVENVKRALIPGHVLSAEMWHEQYKRERRLVVLKAQIKRLQAKVDGPFASLQ